MALDRETTLNKAEKFLRQGRVDAAIAEYVRLAEDQPRDWNTLNTLGDLYVRAGQNAQAVAQYERIAAQFLRDGAYAKAGAFYKKVLKLDGSNERAYLQLADVAAKQGLLVDARAYLNKVAAIYRACDNQRGLAEIALKLGALDPADLDARLVAARALEDMGDAAAAAERYWELHGEFSVKGRSAEGLDVLRRLRRLTPDDRAVRGALADACLETGQAAEAREITEDLLAHEPWDPAHLARLRRALVMLQVDDPDAIIAERLSGRTPLAATDPLVESAGAPSELPVAAGLEEGPVAESPAAAIPDPAPQVVVAAPVPQNPAVARVQPASPAPLVTQSEEIDLTSVLADLQDDEPPAADAPAAPVSADLAQLYDLGVMLEAAGETARALAVFLDVQRQAGGYGDVPLRIDRLSRRQTGG